MSLITDIRALNKVEEFEEGGEEFRTKLNALVAFQNGLKDAADRAVEGKAGATGELLLYVSQNGSRALYNFEATPAQAEE